MPEDLGGEPGESALDPAPPHAEAPSATVVTTATNHFTSVSPSDGQVQHLVERAVEGQRFTADAREFSGDFSSFFQTHYPQVLRSAYLVVQSRDIAQDVAQEAFLVAWRKWSRVAGYDRPDLWVRRVAIRLAIKAAAGRRRRDRAPEETDLVVAAPDVDRGLLAQIAALPTAQRAAIVLFYFEDRPVAEVAEILGCATATAKVHLHRGRQRLAVMIDEGRERREREEGGR